MDTASPPERFPRIRDDDLIQLIIEEAESDSETRLAVSARHEWRGDLIGMPRASFIEVGAHAMDSAKCCRRDVGIKIRAREVATR